MKAAPIVLLGVLGILQLATPLYLAARHERPLREGDVYRFRTAPVDPYDAFRGRFVALNLEPNRVRADGSIVMRRHSRRVYVTLDRDAEGFAVLRGLQLHRPASGAYLPARAWGMDTSGYTRVRFELDRFYLPEDEAPAAERAYREHSRGKRRSAEAVVRVLHGDGVIEDLRIEGKSVRTWIAEGQKGERGP